MIALVSLTPQWSVLQHKQSPHLESTDQTQPRVHWDAFAGDGGTGVTPGVSLLSKWCSLGLLTGFLFS